MDPPLAAGAKLSMAALSPAPPVPAAKVKSLLKGLLGHKWLIALTVLGLMLAAYGVFRYLGGKAVPVGRARDRCDPGRDLDAAVAGRGNADRAANQRTQSQP